MQLKIGKIKNELTRVIYKKKYEKEKKLNNFMNNWRIEIIKDISLMKKKILLITNYSMYLERYDTNLRIDCMILIATALIAHEPS